MLRFTGRQRSKGLCVDFLERERGRGLCGHVLRKVEKRRGMSMFLREGAEGQYVDVTRQAEREEVVRRMVNGWRN